MGEQKAAIRLGVTGGSEVKTELRSIGDTGEQSFDRVGAAAEAGARRAQQAYDRAGRTIEQAQRAQAAAQAKLASIGFGNAVPVPGGKSAEASAAVFARGFEAEDRMLEAKARAIKAALDPLAVAQDRYNKELEETQVLQARGLLTADQAIRRELQLKEALDQEALAHARNAQASGSHRAAMQQLGFQIGDIGTQLASGTSPFIVFAQQGPQVAQAFGMMSDGADRTTGATGKSKLSFAALGAFLTGPWGAALMVGASLLGVFASAMLDGGDAAKVEKDRLDDLKRAKEELVRAGEAAIRTERAETEQKLANARALQLEAEKTRDLTAAKLKAAIAAASAAGMATGEGAGAASIYAQTQVDNLNRLLKDNEAAAAAARGTARQLEIPLAERRARMATDPSFAAEERYDREKSALFSRRVNGDLSEKQLETGLIRLAKARDAELAAIEKQEEASRRKGERDGETVTSVSVAKMLRAAMPGVQVTSTTGGKHVNGSYHYKGQAIDFVPAGGMAAMTKDQVRRIFESRGIDVVELLGPGDKGHSDHFHVAWTKGKLALDDFNAAAKLAEERQRELKQITLDLEAAFDPAGAAASDYAGKLAMIAKAVAAGDVTPIRAGIYRAQADQRFAEARAAGDSSIGDYLERGGGDSLVGEDVIRRAEQDVEGLTAKIGVFRTELVDLKAIGTDALQSILDVRRFEDFGQVGSLMLETLKRKFLELAIVNPLTNLLNGSSGAQALPTLFGLFRGGRASGDQYFGGGLAVVGEFGPELAAFPRGTRIAPATQTRRMLGASNDNPTVVQNFDLRGAIVQEDLYKRLEASADGAAVRGAMGGAALTQAQLRRRARYRMA